MTRLIVISRRDNVGTTQDPIAPGDRVLANGCEIAAREAVPAGHKMAIAAIGVGEGVIKYGSAIGIATMDISLGAHVHTHNVASTRGRGDLHAAGVAAGAARLAEPPDEATEESAVTTQKGRR